MKLKKTNIIIVLLVVITIIFVVGENKKKEDENIAGNSEFETMQVKDLEMKYDEEKEETLLTYKIKNISDKEIAGQTINVMGLDENGSAAVASQIYIDVLEAGGEYNGKITIIGNVTDLVKKLELQKPQVAEPQPEE